MNAMQLPLMHQISARLRVLAGDRRANAAVEFALAAPALFLFMFGIIEVGYALWMQNALDYSVVATARCASLRGSDCTGSPSKVKSYAVDASGASLPLTGLGSEVAAWYFTTRAMQSAASAAAASAAAELAAGAVSGSIPSGDQLNHTGRAISWPFGFKNGVSSTTVTINRLTTTGPGLDAT